MAEYSTEDSQPPRTIGELGRMLGAVGRSAEADSKSEFKSDPNPGPGTSSDSGVTETPGSPAEGKGRACLPPSRHSDA